MYVRGQTLAPEGFSTFPLRPFGLHLVNPGPRFFVVLHALLSPEPAGRGDIHSQLHALTPLALFTPWSRARYCVAFCQPPPPFPVGSPPRTLSPWVYSPAHMVPADPQRGVKVPHPPSPHHSTGGSPHVCLLQVCAFAGQALHVCFWSFAAMTAQHSASIGSMPWT